MPAALRLVVVLTLALAAADHAGGEEAAAHNHGAGAHGSAAAANGEEAGGQEHDAGPEGHELEHGGHAAHDGESAHGHGKWQLDPTNLAVSSMLLGTVVFNMSIFYLVNHRDEDIKHHSWAVLSSTIAIFVSVLTFKGMQGIVRGLVETFIKRVMSDKAEQLVLILTKYMWVVVWFAVMQFTIYRQAREHDHIEHRTVCEKSGNPISIASAAHDVRQKLTCWATLFAHMAGFAAISGGADLQAFGPFGEVACLSFLPVLITAAVLFGLFRFADYLRYRVLHAYLSSKEGEVTGDQAEANNIVILWAHHGEEAENEIGGLSLSFLSVQTLVFFIVGELRHHKANETHDANHEAPLEPVDHILKIIGGAMVFVVLTVVSVIMSLKVKMPAPSVEFDSMGKYLRRWYFIMQTVVSMCFAWCMLFAAEWAVHRLLTAIVPQGGALLNPHTPTQRVLLALTVSFGSFALIFFLDFLHDLDVTADLADTAIKKVIMSIGILIGFSWEEAFNAGVGCFAALSGSDWGTILLKFVLGIVVCIVVVPAWRLYILKNLMKLEEAHHDLGDHIDRVCQPQAAEALLLNVDGADANQELAPKCVA